MLKVGLTGGIGSGKTTIAQTFATIGVKIYDCDQAAHRLTDSDPIIINGLKSMFGADIYKDGLLNRKTLASIIFNDKDALSKVNALIHPRVTNDFNHWCDNRKSEEIPIRHLRDSDPLRVRYGQTYGQDNTCKSPYGNANRKSHGTRLCQPRTDSSKNPQPSK